MKTYLFALAAMLNLSNCRNTETPVSYTVSLEYTMNNELRKDEAEYISYKDALVEFLYNFHDKVFENGVTGERKINRSKDITGYRIMLPARGLYFEIDRLKSGFTIQKQGKISEMEGGMMIESEGESGRVIISGLLADTTIRGAQYHYMDTTIKKPAMDGGKPMQFNAKYFFVKRPSFKSMFSISNIQYTNSSYQFAGYYMYSPTDSSMSATLIERIQPLTKKTEQDCSIVYKALLRKSLPQ